MPWPTSVMLPPPVVLKVPLTKMAIPFVVVTLKLTFPFVDLQVFAIEIPKFALFFAEIVPDVVISPEVVKEEGMSTPFPPPVAPRLFWNTTGPEPVKVPPIEIPALFPAEPNACPDKVKVLLVPGFQLFV